ERRDAGGLALALFEVHQELVGVGREAAQFVEFGVVALREHAAVAGEQRRLLDDGAGQQRGGRVVLAQLRGERLQPRRVERRQQRAQPGQQGETVAQGGQVARARAAERDAREDPL